MVRAILGLASLVAALAAQAAPLVTRVDTAGEVGLYTSLQLNGGNPVVSYYDRTNGALKLATCVADCASAAPAWIIVTIDDTGDVGWYSSLKLNGGNPLVAYYDVTNGALRLATCTAGCATPVPTWVITTIDDRSADTGRFPSLQLDGGKPIISYRDRSNGDLKLATCTGGCATPAPAWTLLTVDAGGDVGRFTTMQLDGGKPVIAYFDFTNGNLKVATCLRDCATASPAWVTTTVDHVPGDAESQFSLRLNAGKPVISYYDTAHGDLKLATCTAGCSSVTPTWVVTVVDSHGDAGSYSSLEIASGNPVVAYLAVLNNCTTTGAIISCHTAMDLRLATCTANCSSASPTWVITSVDNSGLAGYDPSLQLAGGGAFVSYEDFLSGDLKVAAIDLAAAAIPSNYTALWWNFDESGWGINFTHQGDIVFGTIFTYDLSRNPMWLVMSNGAKQSPGLFTGALYRTTGPPFDANPFTPIGPSNIVQVGTMTVEFSGDSASLAYTVNGIAVNKTIRKQVFGARPAICRATDASRAALANYQDLWWNPAESGWGINITHQDDILFATLFTYAASGQGLWLVMSDGRRQVDGSYLGDLYTTTGPAFNATPFPPIGPSNLTNVGTLRLQFASGTDATLTYTFNGTTVVKAITRQVFASPAPACS
jgi:hypothetical protein